MHQVSVALPGHFIELMKFGVLSSGDWLVPTLLIVDVPPMA
jgi:hypothetical protein